MNDKKKKLEILTFGEYAKRVGTTAPSVVRDFRIWSEYVNVYKDTPEYAAMLKRRGKKGPTGYRISDGRKKGR